MAAVFNALQIFQVLYTISKIHQVSKREETFYCFRVFEITFFKLINNSCSYKPTRAPHSGQVGDFETQWNPSWKSLMFHHVFITSDKYVLNLHIHRLLKQLNMNHELDGRVLFHHESANAADNLLQRFRRVWIFGTLSHLLNKFG